MKAASCSDERLDRRLVARAREGRLELLAIEPDAVLDAAVALARAPSDVGRGA